MKIWLAFVVLAALAFSANFAIGQTKSDPASAAIIAQETKWNEAYKRGDPAAMKSLIADDFIITVEDGTTYSKTGYLAHTADSQLRVQISAMSDMKVRMHGSIAIVTGAYHEKGTSKGRPYESHDRFTDVWTKTKTNGEWQVLASHYSIPASQ